MVKEIIFDFDGTIALTLEVAIKVLKNLSRKYGFRKVTNEDVKIFRNEGWRKALKRFNISILKVPQILATGQREIAKEMGDVKMVEGLDKVLIELKSKGFTLGVLTSNSQENVENFFVKQGLEMFDYIYSDKSLFGKDKVINKLLKERKLNKEEVLYVGDELRDWEACEKMGIKMIGVTWGYNSRKGLEKTRVDYLIDKPEEILKILD